MGFNVLHFRAVLISLDRISIGAVALGHRGVITGGPEMDCAIVRVLGAVETV